jgi:hypothetical protein
MFNFFKPDNPTKKIQQWSERISTLINNNVELKNKIDQVGILDGERTISEFIKYNELGLAYEHLTYMISESGIYLTEKQLNDISDLAGKFGLNKPNLLKPSKIETNEFYNLLQSFNNAQKKAINNLKTLWGMKTPITRDEWIGWSQNQHEKDEFRNEHNIKIFPHGFGLSYQDEDVYIDFDFGEYGESNGFDVNRLWFFLETNKIKSVFTNKNQITKVVDFELTSEAIEFSGYINYYKGNKLQQSTELKNKSI